MARPNITTSWTARISPGDNVMDVIQTGLWDDIQAWQDTKIWWDDGKTGTAWIARTPVDTTWN